MCLICHSRLTELRLSRSNELVLRTSISRKAEGAPGGSDCKFKKGATFDRGIGIQIAVFVICKFCLIVRGSCHFFFFPQNMGWVDWMCFFCLGGMCLQIGRQVIQESFSSVCCGLVLFGFVSFCHVELWFQKRAPSAGSFDLLDQSYLVSIHRQPLEATVGDRRTRVWSMALKSVVSNLVSDLAGQHSHDHHAFGQVASSFTAFFPDVAPHHDQFLPSIAPETVHQGDAVHLDQFNESLMATRRPKMPVSFHKEEEEKKDG